MDQNSHEVLKDELLEILASDTDLSLITVTPEMAELLIQHLELVVEKNKSINLTRITNEHEAIVLHVIDSLLLIAHNPIVLRPDEKLLDVGTGAGYPGLPLTIVSGCQSTLIDSVGKKVNAVEEFTNVLGLADRVSCLHARAEEVPETCHSRFDVVVARAVAQTNVLIEYATPCLRRNGTLLVGKGNPSDEETQAASRAARICGLEESGRFEYDLPHDLGHRTILVYTKTGNPRIKLPRQNGMAKRSPLGLH
jgi:16S rRNA (guanine527-N7)-methyltransferase